MKKVILLCIFGILGLMTGCTDRHSPEVVAQNKSILSGQGEFVGTMADGVRVFRWEIDMGAEEHNHYLYRLFPKKKVGESEIPLEEILPEGFLDTTTLNFPEQNGKTTVNQTLVFAGP